MSAAAWRVRDRLGNIPIKQDFEKFLTELKKSSKTKRVENMARKRKFN